MGREKEEGSVRKQTVSGYYAWRTPTLLKRFDKTVHLVKEVFVSGYGADFAETLLNQVRRDFEALIPHLPYVGSGAPALNTFIIISASELAVYKAMKRHGKTAKEAWEVCHEALKVRLNSVPRLLRRLLKFYLFSDFAKRRAHKLAEESQKHPFGEFAFRFVEGGGKDFDWGVDYTGCSIYKFMRAQGAEEFAPYVCLSDSALSDAFGWGLIRTQTLAEGFKRCDFRFKKGGKTRISSTVWKGE